MQAATDDDLVIGVCMHFELVPMPAPTPTPLPHPFVSMISDPGRAAVKASTGPLKAAAGAKEPRPMTIYGLPTTNVGTITKNATVLPHIPLPPGTGWAPMPKAPKTPCGVLETPPPPDSPAMPAGDALMNQGSACCSFGAGAIVRLGDPAQSCSEPARQVSTVLAVPKGGPVLVMG